MNEAAMEALQEKVESLIEKEDIEGLKGTLKEIHPADIAFLFPRLDRDEIHMVFNLLEAEVASNVLVELDDHHQEKVLKILDGDQLAEMVDEMESDEAADVLGSVEPEVAEKVLEGMDRETREDVQHLLKYPEDTAGGIMSTELIAVKEIRKMAAEVEDIYSVWVTDKHGKLLGNVSLKDLVVAAPEVKIGSLVDPDIIKVEAEMDQEQVAHLMKRYDLVTVPVVDASGALLGRVTWDDAMQVLDEESSEDMGYISGTGEEEPSARSVFNSSRERLPWLITGLIGGVISALVMSEYASSLKALITLTFFVPVMTGMGGNVGIQSSTIIVRGLATGEISFQDTGQRLMKELGVGLLNGLVLAFLIMTISYFWLNMFRESLVISFSLLLVILVASMIGVTAPLMLKKMKIDPALAMGPFVTISNDIVGVFIYLKTATFFLMK